MPAVTLVKAGRPPLLVESAADFIDAVYDRGYMPQTGSVEDNYNTFLTGVPAPDLPTGSPDRPVTVRELIEHITAPAPHTAYDVDMPSLTLLFQNGLA